MCTGYLPSRGYYFWKLCPTADTLFGYTIGSLNGNNLDMFVFEAGFNWDSYRRDTNRMKKPRNYGYHYIAGNLATRNGQGNATLEAGTCYYFVVDYTEVGAATQTNWNELWFTHQLTGNPEDVVGYWGGGQAASASTATFSVMLLTILGFVSYIAYN